MRISIFSEVFLHPGGAPSCGKPKKEEDMIYECYGLSAILNASSIPQNDSGGKASRTFCKLVLVYVPHVGYVRALIHPSIALLM